MVTMGKINQDYENCLNQATLWLNRNCYQVARNNLKIVTGMRDPAHVTVKTKETLHFKEWPQRDGSNDKVDILVSMIETISVEEGVCTEAKICVDYFQISGQEAIPTESLHYDYKSPPQIKHPICHVQNSNKVLSDVPESFRYEVKPDALGKRCQSVHIPSAFVNLAGLFAILAADHMTEEHWREFMTTCLTHFQKLPAVAKHPIIDEAIPSSRLHASAWYEK
ncbi:MAG: hypothetical protein ISS69_01070 [Phycisphaerae bacterium]|nr:hypothetical protein [Phycisphaerae bacterium]